MITSIYPTDSTTIGLMAGTVGGAVALVKHYLCWTSLPTQHWEGKSHTCRPNSTAITLNRYVFKEKSSAVQQSDLEEANTNFAQPQKSRVVSSERWHPVTNQHVPQQSSSPSLVPWALE